MNGSGYSSGLYLYFSVHDREQDLTKIIKIL